VTDLFFEQETAINPVENALFGELLAKVAFDLDQEVRRELSKRFAGGGAPRSLAVRLAHDEEGVAAPILRNSRALTDQDLIEVVAAKGDGHRIAVTQRPDVSEAVSDALVRHGGDEVVQSLVSNAGARIAGTTFDRIVERAEINEALRIPVARSHAIKPEHLNRMYEMVEGPMRQEVLARFASFSAEDIDAAMERAKTRVNVTHGALPPDYETASREIAAMRAKGDLAGAKLPNFWRNKQNTHFLVGLAMLTEIDFHTLQRLVAKADVDSLAMLCRASGFERALFVTLAVLVLGEKGIGEASKLGQLYNDVPVEAAQRAMRFMRVRQASAKAA
jgi:uncharacterized protein (DUF2336 family)